MVIQSVSKIQRVILLVLIFGLTLFGCDSTENDEGLNNEVDNNDTSPVLAGSRVLGLAPVWVIGAEEFGDIFPVLDNAGARYIESSLLWDEIELSEGVYTFGEDATGLSNFLPVVSWGLTLGVNAIDTNNDRRPARLRNLAWDDATLIDAYWAFVQSAISHFDGSTIRGVSIGNEVDVYFLSHPEEQGAYIRFVDEIQRRLNQQYPAFKNGVKTTVAGAMREAPVNTAAFVESINQQTDVVMSSYYAIDESFFMIAPENAVSALTQYVNLFPGREIEFIEMGAMSSSACGSSNAIQAQFVRAIFNFWDDHSEQVSLMNFLWMTDRPTAAISSLTQYYSVNTPCFFSHLSSLGFRDAQGVDKGALAAMIEEAAARGF